MKASAPRRLRAVIFDVDGTLAETERDGHRRAFNLAFRDHGLPFHWDVAEYGRLLAVTGGRYRLAWYLAEQGLSDPAGAARVLHRTKTVHFAAWLRAGPLCPRPGVHELLTELQDRGVSVAIATTGRREWVTILLKRLFDDIVFAAVVTGDDVAELKPEPEAYLRALSALGIGARDALAVEDSPPGLAAATAAGIPCLVVASEYHRDMQFPGAAAVVPGYRATDLSDVVVPDILAGGVTTDALRRLHSTALLR
ncbi:HAD-IA family hydrolase [Actinoplanes sp. NPDC049118]|uniref:HAD-IA family hydrolase n=1 Tax=Actinoplanes sp. NPDC049118 TaxID=3155769 RepID=UPI003401EEB2